MKAKYRKSLLVLAVITIVLAGVVSLFASSQPDGLSRVAIDGGFDEKEKASWTYALMPDYSLPWLGDHWLGSAISGLFGLLVMGALVWLLFKWMAAKRK